MCTISPPIFVKVIKQIEQLLQGTDPVLVVKVELMGGSISVHSKEKEGSTFSFMLPLRTVQQMSSCTISSDVRDRTPDGVMWDVEDREDVVCADGSGSVQVSPKKDARQNHLRLQSKVHVRRQSKSRAAKFPVLMSSHRGNSSTALLSQQRERLSTEGARDVEPALAIETKPVQVESGHRLRPDSSAHLDNQGPSLHACCQCPEGLDREGDVKSHTCSNDSSTSRFHGGTGRKCAHYRMRSPPGQSNARKIGKTENFDRSAGVDQSPAITTVVRSSRRFRILVAEDDPVNVKVTTQMITALGHELKVVNNGADAVQAIQEGSYDVVLMVREHFAYLVIQVGTFQGWQLFSPQL